ncbi:unnamed protein product [Urochloa decumbens]|uniref:Uncharacterized protein n=1 Tax=Urochloa decumbens TaxID=240449 RepID=A0ABC9F2Y6_9POAL
MALISFHLGPFTCSAPRRRRRRHRSPLATSPSSLLAPDLLPTDPQQYWTRHLGGSAAGAVEPGIHCVSVARGGGGGDADSRRKLPSSELKSWACCSSHFC